MNVTEEEKLLTATLHLADDPKVPLFEVQDRKEFPMGGRIEDIEISSDHKIVLPNQ